MPVDLSVLPEYARNVVEATITPFGEGAYFAWREDRPASSVFSVRNGVWWREDGKRVLSLAMGTGLHPSTEVDYETFCFIGAADGCCEDVCCHDSRAAADACALTFLIEGRYCSDPR